MDKRSIIGFVLIGLILLVWLYYQNQNSKVDQQKRDQISKQVQDSLNRLTPKDTTKKPEVKKDSVLINIQQVNDSMRYGSLFSKFEKGEDKVIMIETDKYYAEFSTKGGTLIKYRVKGFNTWDGKPVELIDYSKGGELNLIFSSPDGKMINTKNLYFTSTYKPWEKVVLGNNESKIVFTLPVNDSAGARIVKTYTIKNDGSYMFNVDIELQNSNKFLTNYEYQLAWENSLKLTELRSDMEGSHAEAFSYMGDELEIIDVTSNEEPIKSDLTGTTNWVSSRIKYFSVALVANNPKANGSYITGTRWNLPDNGFYENYSIALKMQVKNDKLEKSNFDVYLGPVDYRILKDYNVGLEKTMRFSLDFIVRPIAQYVILPFFLFIHNFISNWGLVIIIFSIAMKIVLSPFTRYQMKSMKKMSEMQPKMNALKEKYKDDPQKQQQALMKFYKEEKINPAGGCLPLLLQMPILYALFGVFSSTIELRQAHFMLWINDLSIPDVIMHLPFKIPLFGIDQFSGLALLMGITMFIQQKMTVKDPKQMAMVYMMPVMMTLLFTTLPAGLNLYYFIFNLLSIGEQYYVTHVKGKKDPDDKSYGEVKIVQQPKPTFKYKGKK
ncbi:MAG: membrane protein insertase YidC [Ignavibacteriae bacterium]|nr:MAG: membrane protein insertase YidC [Ignavibacteriota bacterium]